MNDKKIVFEHIIASMQLRVPQEEALKSFHDIISSAELPLKEMTPSEVAEFFRLKYPDWDYSHASPEFTFHLATGVGKTRLIGAVMAYLFMSGESKDFMIVTPRSEIIRKFTRICGSDDNYLFVDTSLVDYPSVFGVEHSVRDYQQPSMFANGPKVWILSPQAFTANNARLKNTSENDICSPVEYLSQLDDLIIFFDESHHLGLDSEQDSVWRSELNLLNPKMIIGTTASVNEGQNNIIYSYDLKTCLNEHKYTKFVRMIPDKKPDMVTDEEYDRITLRFALKQLDRKQKFIDDYIRINNLTNRVKATMLVACEDIPHAEAITEWLQTYLDSRDSVLLVHSKMNENEFLPRLKKVEDPHSPIKVIVNVGMLNEGWDVSNIYVIAPLRAMASTTLVTQIMGRGLRLPFGFQVGDDEVDTLDVICFGRESMQEIVTKLTQQGFGIGRRSGITVNPAENNPHTEDDFIPKKKIFLNVVGDTKELHIPQFKMEKEPLPLDQVNIPALKPNEVNYFLINDPKTIKRLGNNVEFGKDEFLKIVTSEILKQCKYLMFARHYAKVKRLTERFLANSKLTGERINLDPSRVVVHIVDCLNKLNKQQKVTYVSLPEEQVVDLTAITVNVLETYEYPNDNSMPVNQWSNRIHKGIPFGGWRRSIYEAVPFDNKYEYRIAHIIDTAEEVCEWFRNLPGIITLATPVGNYSPDFAIFLNLGDKNVLLELKDDDRFGREDQDATIKAKAAKAWCNAQSMATGKPWEYWLLLTSDSERCETFLDIEENSDI